MVTQRELAPSSNLTLDDPNPFASPTYYVVYVLVRKGKVVYVGITEQNARTRLAQHRQACKKVDEMRIIEMRIIAFSDANGNPLSRRGARNIEGSALHHADGKGLVNKSRTDGQYYHSYSDPPGKGRMLLPQTQTDWMITDAMAGTTPYDPTTGTGTIVKQAIHGRATERRLE